MGWITGWLNVLGQFATTAFAADILVAHIASMWVLGNGHVFTNVEMLLAYAGIHNPLLTSNGLDNIMLPLQDLLNLRVLLNFDAAEMVASDGVAYSGSDTGGGCVPELGEHTWRQVACAVLGGVPTGGRRGCLNSALGRGANAAASVMGHRSL